MPTVTRSVRVASRTRPTMASGLGLRDAMWPPIHSESIGRASSSLHLPSVATADDPDLDVASRHGHRSTSFDVGALAARQTQDRVEHVVVVLAHQRTVTDLDVEVGEEPRLAHDAGASELGVVDVDEDTARRQMRIGRQRSRSSSPPSPARPRPAAPRTLRATTAAAVHAPIASSISAAAARRASAVG